MGSCQSTTAAVPAASLATSANKNKPVAAAVAKERRNQGLTKNDLGSGFTADTHRSMDDQDDDSHRNNASSTTTKPLERKHSRVGLDAMIAQRHANGHLVENVVHIESPANTDYLCIERVYDGVQNGTELGQGVAGVVRQVTHRATGLPYAVKVLTLERLVTRRGGQVATTTVPDNNNNNNNNHDDDDEEEDPQEEALRNEITIMSQLDHPHIARLQEVYEDADTILGPRSLSRW